jgi:hypothetical protein
LGAVGPTARAGGRAAGDVDREHVEPVARHGSASAREEPDVDVRLSNRAIAFAIHEVDPDG